eukprot:3862880-Prymnesium_polylepis.1
MLGCACQFVASGVSRLGADLQQLSAHPSGHRGTSNSKDMRHIAANIACAPLLSCAWREFLENRVFAVSPVPPLSERELRETNTTCHNAQVLRLDGRF